MAKRARLRLRVTEIAPGGDGVGHVDEGGERRAVFVAGGAPGDELEAEVDLSSRPARGRILQVITPSPERRQPPCPHAASCGGCALMHLTPQGRLAARASIAEATVLRVLPPGSTPEVVHHEAPAEAGYRTRARLAVTGGNHPFVGFHRASARQVVDIPSCLVLAPALSPVFDLLRGRLKGSKGKGEASVALGVGGRPVISLSWKGELAPSAFAGFERAVAEGQLAGVQLSLEGARVPAKIGDPTPWTVGADGHLLEAPGFAQANPEVAVDIARHLAQVCPTEGREVAELYAGSGTFTVALARGASRYLAVESDAAAVEAARRNLERRAITGVKLLVQDAARAPLPKSTSLVVLDPPRAGAAEALAGIAATRATDVLYVSCDPVTLARDVKNLQGAGFSLRSLHTFDMFPQTSHLESVAHLVRGRGE